MAGSSGDKFGAFISYSRGVSGQLAVDLQNGIERYAKPWNKLRAVRVFRDDSSMSANASLWSAIEVGLRESEWFILLATPEAAASDYVNNEVAWWVEHKSADRILLVRAGGDIEWDRGSDAGKSGGDFDRERSTAIPPALFGAHAEEPRWIDVTWYAQSESLGKSDPRFNERVVDLASAIRGIERDTLIGENVAQHRKTRRLTRGAIAGLASLLILALIAGGLALAQKAEATRQRDTAVTQATIATARQLAATSQSLQATDQQQALIMSAYAYDMYPDGFTESALFQANAADGQLVAFFNAGAPVSATAGTPDGKLIVAGTSDGRVVSWSPPSQAPTEVMKLNGSVNFVGVSDDGATIVGSAAVETTDESGLSKVASTDTAVSQAGTIRKLDYPVHAISPSARTMAQVVGDVVGLPDEVVIHRADGSSRTFPGGVGVGLRLVLPDDATLETMDEYAKGRRIDLGTGAVADFQVPMGTWMFGMDFSPDGFFTFTNGGKEYEIWSPDQMSTANGELISGAKFASGGSGRPAAIALSNGGEKLATVIDGRIYVGTSVPASAVVTSDQSYDASKVPAPLTLAGTGPVSLSVSNLNFLGQNTIISYTGPSVSLWNLNQTTRMGKTIQAKIPNTCSACGAPKVLVNPSGTQAVVINTTHSGDEMQIVNLTDGRTRWAESYSGSESGSIDGMFIGDAVWLDDEQLAVFSAYSAEVVVLSGDQLTEASAPIQLPGYSGDGESSGDETSMVMAPEGSVLLATGTSIYRMDTESGQATQTVYPGGELTVDGSKTILVDAPRGNDGMTAATESTIVVFDVGKGETTAELTVNGDVVDAADAGDGSLILWRSVPNDKDKYDERIAVSRLNVSQNTELPLGVLPTPAYNRTIGAGDIAVEEVNGIITMTDFATGGIFPIGTSEVGVRQWTSFGVSGDGKTLVISNQPTNTVSTMVIGADQWSKMACRTADADMPEAEWIRITGMPAAERPSCAVIAAG